MGWDISKQLTEEIHNFSKAIPKDAATWVRIDKVRPGANAIMEGTLSEATLVYTAGEVRQRQTVHWELVKFTACWLTHLEANFEREGKMLFPVRAKRSEEVSRDAFARAWNQLLPLEITDEWMAAVMRVNPIWYDLLRVWIPLWWLRQWMPEKLEETTDDETQEVRQEAKKEVTLGEDLSE